MKIAFFAKRNPLFTFVFSLLLAIALLFGDSSAALAAKSGGRIGGGSFRAPTRTMPAPGRSGGGGFSSPGYGGGFGFPFILPFFGFGGGFGSLFTILIFFAIANFLVRSLSSLGSGNSGYNDGGYGYAAPTAYDNPPVSVTKVQVGLLANARELQAELDALANRADTGTASGRVQVLQEATLALLRHPEYWVYGAGEAVTAPLSSAEAKFNQFSLAERSKFTEETLSNVNSQLKQADLKGSLNGDRPFDLADSREYILVTVLAGIEGKLDIPAINDSGDLRRALQTLGGIGSDRLLAVEVLWTPQAKGDTLTTEDILAAYPDLKLV